MHTPGPWHATDCRHQKNGQIRIFADSGAHIANVLASNPCCEGNGSLIAEAPAMLEALKALCKELSTRFPDLEVLRGETCSGLPAAYFIAEDVARRAEGREP